MEAQFLTDCGRVRNHNEDSGGIYYNSSGQLLAIIADGMGGHQAGDVASEMAVAMIQLEWEKSQKIFTPDAAEKWLTEMLTKMNQSIYEHAQEKKEYIGMGATVVVALSTDEFITIAHIGDSRCYIANENGFSQITEDHSLVNELVRSGQITKEEAMSHPRKNIVLRALGTEEKTEADIRSLDWEAGNKLLLCSDGLTDKIVSKELAELLQSENHLKDIGQSMVNLANERGGEDNITLVIIHHHMSGKVGEDEC